MMMLFWHLKSFMYSFMMTTMARAWYNLNRTNITAEQVNSLVAALLLVPVAALSLELRELIQYGEDDSPYDRMDGTEYFIEILKRSGLLGLSQLAFDMSDAEERGKIGILSVLGGPTFDQFQSGIIMPWEKSVSRAVPGLNALPEARKAFEDIIQ